MPLNIEIPAPPALTLGIPADSPFGDFSTPSTDYFNLFKDSFSNYIVRPLTNFGVGGFIFDVEGETLVEQNAQITDHYTENNMAVQDAVAIEPRRITLKNYAGEVVYTNPGDGTSFLQSLTRKLTIAEGYLQPLTDAAQQAKSLFEGSIPKFDVDSLTSQQSLNTATNIWAAIKNLVPPTEKQTQAYLYFEALLKNKIPTSVQTPFSFFPQMLVERISARQDETTKFYSEFQITFKELRTVSTAVVPFDASQFQSRTGQQREDEQDAGKTQGGVGGGTPTSALYSIQGQIGKFFKGL